MAKLVGPRTSQSSQLRHVSSGSSATKQNEGDDANESVRETGPGPPDAKRHESAPVRRLFVLSIHDETFSRDDVVLNISNDGSIPIGCLLRLTPLKGGTTILHPSMSDEDIDLDKQYVFICKALGHDLLSKQPGLEVSLLQSIAWKFGIQKGTQVLVSTADEASCSASHVEIVFRDQYLARADMWRLISAELANTCIFRGQTIVFMGTIKATIKTIYVKGKKLPSALFHCSTKPIFRSESARYVLFIQMSKEMWNFDAEGSGEIMFDKVINGFLPELFRRWQEMKVRHLVSIVLFTRMVYEDRRDEGFTKSQNTLAGAIGTSRDFYRVVVSDMASGEWATILAQLKQEFLVFLRDISIQEPAVGDHLPLDAGLSVASTDLPTHVIAGHPSAAIHGNVLEAMNLASSQFSADYIDRDLDRTGVSIVVISPSAGLFEVDYDLLAATTENLIDNGVGIDLVCLSKMPLHSVPLFKYRAPQSMFEDAALASVRTREGEEKALEGSFSNNVAIGGGSLKTYTYDTAPLKEPEAESDSKVLEWSYGIPHWVDISFWDSLPDESVGTKSSAMRRKLKNKSSFDAPQHKAFVPRVRMYELQMMGVMENAISDISIPQLSRPSASAAAISQAFESSAFTESSRRNSSVQSPYGSFRTAHSISLDQTSKHSTPPRSNRPTDKRSIGLLYDWMDEYDDLVFRHPLVARKRPRRTKVSKSASRDRQSRNNSLSLRSTSSSTQNISSSHLKHSFDRDSFLSQMMLERHASQKKDASRGRLGSRPSSIKSTGPRPNLTPHQISFGPQGLGASASKAVASTELSIDHGAASLSRGLKWRPPNVLTDHNSAAPAHAIGNRIPDRLSPELSDKRGSDLVISSESESQIFSRPIPIRNTTAVRIIEGKIPHSRTQGHLGHPSGVELHERLSELQDLRDVERYAPMLKAQDVDEAEPVQTSLSPNTTLAPWLTILNPSNPTKTKSSLASRLGRWHHIFPRPLRTSQIKWKSLCSPAAVPLTTEDIPTTEQLLEEYQASVYSVDIPEKMDLAETPRSLITELIAFRLSRGFQIVVGERLSKSVKMPALFSKPFDVFDEQVLTEDCSTIFLSRGSTIHQIRRLSDSKVEVKQLVRHKNVAQTPHTEAEPAVYKPSIRSMLTKEYEIQNVSIAPQRAAFDWKMIDSFIVGNERPKAKDFVDNLRPWRARFVLIPVETPRSVRRPYNSINEDDEEEVRLEGISKLSQVWQRFRYVPPDERHFQPPSRSRKDTNPLDIMYQTRDPSAIVAAELENVAEGDASGRPVQLLPESDLYQRPFKISALAETIQDETKGVRMRDRRWHFRLHYNCFIGEELTTWLKNNFRDIETRDEAVKLGKDLMRDGLFKHVEGRHDFRDGNYFYQIADEYRAPRPESRGWFGRSKASVPSTPVSENLPKNPPLTSRSRASSGSAGTSADASEPTTPTGTKQKLGVALSKSLMYDVDHRKRSYRSELINLHYDRLHNPDNCYHIRIEWMNTTPKLIKDTITSWATSVDRFGLRLVEVPIGEASSITSMHPFRSPYRIKLKVQPPAKQPLSYFDSTNFAPQQTHRKHYYQKALLKRFEFVLDFEAASDFPPDVDVTYSWGKPDYKYPQYIHRSGRLIAQITDEGDFLLLANRLYNDHGASAKSFHQEVAKGDNPSDGEGHRGPGFFRSNPHGGNRDNFRGSPRLSPYSSPSMRATLDIASSTPNATRGPSPVSNPLQLQSSPKPKSAPTSAETLKQAFEAFCNDKEALDKFYEETLSKASTPGPNTPFLGGKTPSRGPMTPSHGPEKLSMESSIPSLALPETLTYSVQVQFDTNILRVKVCIKSFGYSVGDLIAVVQIANKVRRRFVDSPAQFQAISDEAKGLSNVLRDLDDIIPDRSLSQEQVVDLQDNLHACKNLLNDLDITLDKYQILDENGPRTLNAKSRRIWKRLKWEPADIKELRDRLASTVSLLNAFLGSIAISVARATQASVDRVISHQAQQRHSQILDWLSPDDYSAQQTDLFRRCNGGTGQWLLNSHDFKLWLRGERLTLFCPGIPGAGKTMLTSLVVHSLQEMYGHDASVGIAYVYCNFKRQTDQMVDDLLASLLKGLLQRQADFPQDVELLYQRHKSKGSRASTTELLYTIKAITRDSSRIFLVIDALDECTGAGTRARLLKEVASLQDQQKLSFFATSRFLPDILEEFKGQLTLEIRATDGDVRTYITDRMTELPAFVRRNNILQERIVSEITAAVDGMFLLAKLNLDSLSDKMTVKAIKAALQELPKGSKALDLAYKEALQRIESQKSGCQQLAKSIMSWIVCGQKQLTTLELRYALAIEDESSELDEDNLPDVSEVIAVCAGLVIIDEKSDVVRLVHYTAQEFFERTTSVWAPFAEEMIARSCLTYLSFGSVVESCSNFIARKGSTGAYDTLCQDNVLVRYATHYWGYHAEKCWTDTVERRVLSFLEDKKRVTTYFEVTFDPRGPAFGRRREVTAVHLLAYLGLPTAMSKLLCEGYAPDPKATNGKTPLFYACCKGVGPIEGGQEAVVKLLLSQNGIDVNSVDESGSTPLSMAAWYDREAIATSLLDYQGIRINGRNNLGQTPLMVALETGNIRTAQIIIERYDIERLDVTAGEGADLLDLAITKGDKSIARLLLQNHNIQVKNRADLHFGHTDHHGQTLLAKAVEAGNHEIVNLLLHQAGVRLSHHDLTRNDTRIKAVQALLGGIANTMFEAKSINLYVEDNCGRKAPMLSAKIELGVVLNLSLKPNGNWISYGPENVSNILLHAACSGLEHAVAFLLEIENIQLNFRDEVGRTALMLASEIGQEAVVVVLLENFNVQTNCKDKDGRTALMLAAQSGHPGVVAVLLENFNVQTNCKDKDGRTALMLAARLGHADVVTLLLEDDSVVKDCKDRQGRSAMSLAALGEHTEVMSLLLAWDSQRPDSSSGDQNQIALARAAYMYCCYESRRCGGSIPLENDVCTDSRNLISQAWNIDGQGKTR